MGETKVRKQTVIKSSAAILIILSGLGLGACNSEKQEQAADGGEQTLEQKIEKAGEDAENAVEGTEETLSQLVDKPVPLKQEHAMDQIKTHTGMIVYKDFEGGFYAFEGDKGERFILSGVNKSHLKHGLIVEITGTAAPDIMTTTQYGTVFKLKDLKVLDASKVDPALGIDPKS
jgi:hypothetical protein